MRRAAGLFILTNFLSSDRLRTITPLLEAAPGELAAIQPVAGGGLSANEEVRRAWEIELADDLHEDLVSRIHAVHPEVESFFAQSLEPCEAVAALRYPPGAFYRTHRDVAAQPDAHQLHRRAVSIVVFLNSGAPVPKAAFTGGALRLHETDDGCGSWRDVVPVAGTLIAFRSDVLHEVLPVATGTRLTAVTWLARRPSVRH
jgi:SM-20-related protein